MPLALEKKRPQWYSKSAASFLVRDTPHVWFFLAVQTSHRGAPIPKKHRDSTSAGVPSSVGGSGAPTEVTPASSDGATIVDASKTLRRKAFAVLSQGTIDMEKGTFTPARHSSSYEAILIQSGNDLAGGDFSKVLAQFLQDKKEDHNIVASLLAFPRLNLSQFVAWINGSLGIPTRDSDVHHTAAFMAAHVLPRGDLFGVPKRGEDLVEMSRADSERARELAVGTHASQLTNRSTRIVGTTHLEDTHQIARGFANMWALLLVGLVDPKQEGSVAEQYYRAAVSAADADTVREGKKQIVATPALYHTINHSIHRYVNVGPILCVVV